MRQQRLGGAVGAAVLLAVSAAIVGCRPGQAQDARDAFCSDAAFRSVDVACARALARARTTQELERITTTCLETIEAQRFICGDAP